MKLHIIMDCPDLCDMDGPPPWTKSPNPLYYMLLKECEQIEDPYKVLYGKALKIKMAGDLTPTTFSIKYTDTEVICNFIGKLEFVEKLGGQHITMNNGNE